MKDNNLYDELDFQTSHPSDGIYYNPSSALNALRCLFNMQKFEDIPNFGKINEHVLSGRYDIKSYSDKIDSTFYTDMATSTLSYTMQLLNDWYHDFGDTFDDKFLDEYITYIYDEHDLVNDSNGEFAGFEGDDSFLESDMYIAEALYAYYSEFQLVENDERNDIINRLDVSGISNEIIIKKTENINGVDMDFYYVSEDCYGLSQYLFKHDYNTKFYSDRMPGNILEAITTKFNKNDIITVTEGYRSHMSYTGNWAAYADYEENTIVVKDDYFTDVICHETGHLFDHLNAIDVGKDCYVDFDYTNFVNLGRWDRVAEKYADEIATIRRGADISCGYTSDGMRNDHSEFYAEAFQLYFYSDETRAALPNTVRERLEKEIEKYAN